jgi:hypothetical protein
MSDMIQPHAAAAVLLLSLEETGFTGQGVQRQTSTNQRDALGQDTGRSQGLLSSYLPEERPQQHSVLSAAVCVVTAVNAAPSRDIPASYARV